MRIPLKFIHHRGAVAINGFGPIAQGTDEKPVGWLDTESRTVIYANKDEDEVAVESIAKFRRAKVAKK